MVEREQIEEIINSILNQDITETDKCSSSSSGSGGGKKKPKKKPSKSKPKELFEKFDKKNFQEEEYPYWQEAQAHPHRIGWDWKSPRGTLQKIQHDLQWSEINKYDFSDFEIMRRWSTDIFRHLNSYLFGKEDCDGRQWTGKDTISFGGDEVSLKQCADMLSKAIDKSPRLQENCVTYKLCPTDVLEKMEIGEAGKFDGFQSTSFNYTVCTKALQDQVGGWLKDGNGYRGSNRAMVRYYNMKGTKGVNIGESVSCHDWQSEWLLDKNQPFVLVGKGMVDYDGQEIMTYDVLVYD